ncbi:hypothetical protein EVAR_43075_1 [Eumeta japonica]|uniref:Uncharacterized protein n=1 Tax=Eumeta variegata TaxID=151549 RepID=A0A4C1WWQ6_EUMVA|nr:hypothetical protein EVAR_43075_1 [Eumeta japonica]
MKEATQIPGEHYVRFVSPHCIVMLFLDLFFLPNSVSTCGTDGLSSSTRQEANEWFNFELNHKLFSRLTPGQRSKQADFDSKALKSSVTHPSPVSSGPGQQLLRIGLVIKQVSPNSTSLAGATERTRILFSAHRRGMIARVLSFTRRTQVQGIRLPEISIGHLDTRNDSGTVPEGPAAVFFRRASRRGWQTDG